MKRYTQRERNDKDTHKDRERDRHKVEIMR